MKMRAILLLTLLACGCDTVSPPLDSPNSDASASGQMETVASQQDNVTTVSDGKIDAPVPLQNPALKPFYTEMRGLFRRHYPKATSHLLEDTIHFEDATRLFIVHEALKTGEWQDPWEERGPRLGGVLCDMTLRKGRYQGAATVPQTFDKRYFKVLFLAPYSAKRDVHLVVRLAYPRDVNDDFLTQFMEQANDFGEYLE